MKINQIDFEINPPEEKLPDIKKLFIEYANTLGFDLSFQDFDKEISSLIEIYSPPYGALIIAKMEEKPIGCVALRKINENICEMKRLYVKLKFRGRGIGKILVFYVLKEAKRIGYKFIRLDTVPKMREAIALYKSFGFYEIEAYRYNPVKGAKFMEFELKNFEEKDFGKEIS